MNFNETKNLTYKFEFIHDKEKIFIELKSPEDNKLEINITKGKLYYTKEFSTEILQKNVRYFKIFDSMKDIYEDLKLKFEKNNYELNFEHFESRIIIQIKTNIYKNDFDLEIPIKNNNISNVYTELLNIIKNNNDEIKQLISKSDEKIEEINKKMNSLECTVNSLIKDKIEKINLFEESTIIKTDYEKKLIESFIKENDSTKKMINTNLLFKATIDGDTPKDFHKKCDFMGATIVIVQSENGRRFGGYSSISWDQTKNGWINEGIVFLFSLDTRKYYKNTQNSYYTNHTPNHGPEFGQGHDLTIVSWCLNNSKSYSTKASYGMTSQYELNGGTKNFKVLDYEVFQI